MDVRDKKVLVFGSGISGEAACSLLLANGAEVVLYDGNDKLDTKEILAKISGSENGKITVVLGALSEEEKKELFQDLTLTVMSP